MELLMIISFLAVIGLVFLIIVVYKYLYKRNINKALGGEKHSSNLIEPFAFIQFILLIILLITSFVLIGKVNDLTIINTNQSYRINDLISDVNSLNNNFNDLEDEFQDYIEYNQWVFDSSFSYDSIDIENDLMGTRINFTLNEIQASSTVYLVATNVDDYSDSVVVEVISSTLNYSGIIDLNMDKEYAISILEESLVGSRGEDLFILDFPLMLSERIQPNITTYIDEDDDYFGVQVSNKTFGLSELDLVSVVIKMYDEDVLIETVDITSSKEYSDFMNSFYYSYYPEITFGENVDYYSFEIIIEDNLGIITTFTLGF